MTDTRAARGVAPTTGPSAGRRGVGWPDFETSAEWLFAHRSVQPFRQSFRTTTPQRAILTAVVMLYFFTFVVLLVWRHERFGTFDFDLGIFDQNVWLLSQGEGFITIRGMETFGHHASYAHILFVPLYWLGAGPNMLNIAMVAAVCLATIPLYRIANHHLRNEWHSLVLTLAFLFHPTTTWLLQETYHPEVIAIAPMFAAWHAALREKWVAYGLWLAFAVTWKEDIAMAIVMIGLVMVIRHRPKVGLITMGAAASYFLLVTRVIIPAFSPEGAFFEQWYGHLGGSPIGLAETAATDPMLFVDQLYAADALGYARDMALPYGFTSILSPVPLLIALPQAAANLLSINGFTWNVQAHYAAMVLVAFTISMVEGVARPTRAGLRRFLVGAVAACTLATTVSWGIGPFSTQFRQGFWPLDDRPKHDVLQAAAAMPEGGDSVTASYNLVPHMSQRSLIYSFPNPWETRYWGVLDQDPHDPDAVEWLVVDRTVIGDDGRQIVEDILAGDEWVIRLDQMDVLVAQRVDFTNPDG